MVQLSLPQHSKVSEGKTFGKDGKNKIVFNVYRWNRESGENPIIDKFFIDNRVNCYYVEIYKFMEVR